LINLTITIFGLMLLFENADPVSLALAYMIGSILSTAYIFWSIRKEFRGITWRFSKENFKIMYNFSWPIVIISLFGLLFSLDTVMLGQMKSAAAQRLISFSSIVPGFIAASLFPILSKYESDTERLGYIFEKVIMVILAIGIPVTIGGIFFSKEIILLVLGTTYIAVVPVLSVLMVSILASFPNIILTNVIFSKNLQKIFITATAFGVLVNILLNLWLIPKYGAVGAALSTTIAELIIMGTNWKRLKKFIPFSVIPKLGKIGIATLIMAGGILILNMIGIHFIITIVIAIGIYAFSLKILKEQTFKEILALAHSQ
jgi:O-antigen/teichoic acid export membrane protein